MSVAQDQTALMCYLKAAHDIYYGKVLELREVVQGWLAYIPATFPHYTRHTIQHSDEIVLQISKLLFRDDDPKKISVPLSALEAYILIVSAYLHDSGMVASDNEKKAILQSDAWKTWTSNEEGGARRWQEIEKLRRGHEPADDSIRNFLADIQTRFLIAEFIRRVHHIRATEVIQQHTGSLARFAFDDPILQRTISDVCMAHGLRLHELEDRERYPDQRDIRGQKVNVRFMAILLRLGDLLDLTCDRACPLLLNAACPLPADSPAHWSQYQRFTHRLTTPDRVEITAECHSQKEHQILQDWCQWLVDEVRHSATVMARSSRHNDWKPPVITIGDAHATLNIRPASTATYFPSKWVFELDHDVIFQRLINDIYDHPSAFIRELIQNALDANRCQMYADLIKEGIAPPEFPTQVDEIRRRRYPVEINLRIIEMQNPLSEETEKRQFLTVNDSGIGMDREVIQRYFLQVGRSYYTTEEFRRSFRFVPTSRFGVGFLSVFAVSDHVTVETHKPNSQHSDGPLRLSLTGPRNYLLTERGDRQQNGTQIEVLLREGMEPGDLIRLIRNWCKRVEFPIIVDDLGLKETVEAERADQFAYELPDVTDEGAKFVVRSFPVDRHGIEGELYVLARIDSRGEAWDIWSWSQYHYPTKHPQAVKPNRPESLTCLHGIVVTGGDRFSTSAMAARIDYRSYTKNVTLSRDFSRRRHRMREEFDPEVQSRWEEVLREHLSTSLRANSEDGWKYKQHLVSDFSLESFWSSVPGSIRIWVKGESKVICLNDIRPLPLVTTTVTIGHGYAHMLGLSSPSASERTVPAWDNNVPTITDEDIDFLSSGHRNDIFKNRSAVLVRWLTSGHIAIDWESCAENDALFAGTPDAPVGLAVLPNASTIGFAAHKTTGNVSSHLLLNTNNMFVKWLLSVKTACVSKSYGLKDEQFKGIISQMESPLKYHGHKLSNLVGYIEAWKQMPNLSPELYPPDIKLTEDMFCIYPHEEKKRGQAT
jgi:molecular chaperone HtpG